LCRTPTTRFRPSTRAGRGAPRGGGSYMRARLWRVSGLGLCLWNGVERELEASAGAEPLPRRSKLPLATIRVTEPLLPSQCPRDGCRLALRSNRRARSQASGGSLAG
jgi:hypothetical protein